MSRMPIMKLRHAALFAAVLTLSPGSSALADSRRDDVVRLTQELGEQDQGAQIVSKIIDIIVDRLAKQYPNIPQQALDTTRVEAHADQEKYAASYHEAMIASYEANLSESDVKGLNAFFAGEAGRHYLAAQQKIKSDMMPFVHSWGAQIGQEMGRDIKQSLRKKGYTI